jgi:hypothetical protein
VAASVGAGGELRLSGPAMAPRYIEGPYRDDVATGRRGRVEGRRLFLDDASG